MADPADQAVKNRNAAIESGVADVESVAGDTYDAQMIAVAASFLLQLGKQFDIAKFLAEVGVLRLRWLEPLLADLTTAAGVYIVAEYPITAPPDRHQLLLGAKMELFTVPEVGFITEAVEYRDAQQIARLGVLDIKRPQGDVVQEGVASYLCPAQQLEIDNESGGGDAASTIVFIENRQNMLQEIVPMGLSQAVMYAWGALISPSNQMNIKLQNLAAAGLSTPSTLALRSALHVLAIDCIKGGKG